MALAAAPTYSPGQFVFVHYGKDSERPRVPGALQGTIKRQAKVVALYGGVAAVKFWSNARESWSEPVRVGLNTLEPL